MLHIIYTFTSVFKTKDENIECKHKVKVEKVYISQSVQNW